MSFSGEVKEELSKLSNLANKSLVKAEMYGYLNTNNISEEKGKIRFSTESEYNINRFSKLLNNLGIYQYEITIIGKNFSIMLSKRETNVLRDLYCNYEIERKEGLEKAFVRGTFLGSGSINDPKNKYHLEIALRNLQIAEREINILENYGIYLKILNVNSKKVVNKDSKNTTKFSIYSKDGEEISKFLAFVGASASVLKFEEIRVYRDMRNNVNRIVNCETANLAKTVDAAVKQINAIKILKEKGKFNELPDNLKELANLRLENPEASLSELGKMLKEPIGKSGVNYRLKTIVNLAQ